VENETTSEAEESRYHMHNQWPSVYVIKYQSRVNDAIYVEFWILLSPVNNILFYVSKVLLKLMQTLT
jgi:hypothetical protein